MTTTNHAASLSRPQRPGLLHHTLCCCTNLVERCRCIGALEAFLEAATLRSEFKTVASDLKTGLERLETDHLHVPADIADDVAALAEQLGRVEFSVASEQEATAAEIHRMVLMERVGLAHDQQIMAAVTVRCGCLWLCSEHTGRGHRACWSSATLRKPTMPC